MAQISPNSTNIVISGSPTFCAIQNLGASKIDEGLKILCDHTSPGALHDSGERFDPPNCHPETRVAVREEIMTWIDDPASEFPVMWMNGAMGGGKSSIAQAIAELYHERGQLSGSFFFARASSTRNNEKRLVATLAYQILKEMPEMRSYISATILHDPLIFESSLKSQIKALIIGPHSYAAGSAPSKPRLIIIDGLDECINTNAQALIAKLFASAIAAHRDELSMSLKLLIVSRPETNIETAFRDPKISHFVKRLSLNDHWLPANDIRRFLVHSFSGIKHDHPQGTSLPEDWPSVDNIEKLVEKSSGQFIYASVVIKFLQSPRNHPIHSLKVILGLAKDDKRRPYAELDALYVHIFSKVEDLQLVLRILCLGLAPRLPHGLAPGPFQFNTVEYSTCSLMEDILELPEGILSAALSDLVSVLAIDPDDPQYIKLHHASLSEFLEDQDRAGKLYVNSDEIHVDLARRCIPIMKNAEFPWSRIWRLYTFKASYTRLSAEARSSLSDAISNLDIMSPMEDMDMFHTSDAPYRETPVKYLEWFFAEHAQNLTTSYPNSLGHAVKNISEYILRQFKAFPFSGFDQTDRLDLWVFAIVHDHQNHSLGDISRILSILTESDCSEFANVESSPAGKFCWQIIHTLPLNVLGDVALFGEYSMTGARYLPAALSLFKAIPKMNSYSCRDPLSNYLHCYRWRGTSLLLGRTPASKDLFRFFRETMIELIFEDISGDDLHKIAYKYVVLTYGYGPRKHNTAYAADLAAIFSNYMFRTREEIPDIDFIEESKAEDRVTSSTQELRKRTIITIFRNLYRGKTKER